MKKAFTLAEVLITLGIIGVVAAMTIPTLISNTSGAQFKTAYKKTLSSLNQAILMNLAMDDFDFSQLADENSNTTKKKMSKILTTRFQSATRITDTYEYPEEGFVGKATIMCTAEMISEANADDSIVTPCRDAEIPSGQFFVEKTGEYDYMQSPDMFEVYSFADGTTFAYNKNAKKCISAGGSCVGFIDVNGSTGPNIFINCPSVEDGTSSTCETSEITDIYPVLFHGQTVEPATKSAKAVLYSK